MNKKYLSSVALVGLLSAQALTARELRTPLTFMDWWNRYPVDWPLGENDETNKCGLWNFELRGAGYHRESDAVYTNSHGTKTEPWAGAIFNQPVFVVADAFCGGQAPENVISANPFVAFARLAPQISYSENGAFVGLQAVRSFRGGCMHAGVRAVMPFRRIETTLENCCDLILDDLSDVMITTNETVSTPNSDSPTQVIQNSYAYRLDFLSALRQSNTPNAERFVRYGTGAAPNVNTFMNDKRVSFPAAPAGNDSPVSVIAVDAVGSRPKLPFAVPVGQVGAPLSVYQLPLIPDNGVVADEARARFGPNNYAGNGNLGTDRAAQSRLWVVPTYEVSQGNAQLLDDAYNIQTQVGNLVRGFNQDPIQFLEENGVTFNTQNNVGVGDLDLAFFVNNWWCQYFVEGMVGVRFPTGKRIKEPGRLLLMPRGNNGHYEVRIGALGSVDPLCWMRLKLDLNYNHAFSRTERVASAFEGATVKNIGPATDAKISWCYFVADADMTLFHPCNHGIGFDLGYSAYVKSKDRVSFKNVNGVDFGDQTCLLSDKVLEARTKVVAHKVRVESFFQGDYYEAFGGWQHVFAGKNAPRETDWYLGMKLYF